MVSWRNSVVSRYVALSLMATVLPLLTIGGLYDRYSSNLLERLTGERLERRLTVMSSGLSAFVTRQLYQLETLAEYPFLAALLAPVPPESIDASLQALVAFEANQPDLYGILLFAPDGRIVRAVPGQAASGSPYWGSDTFSLDGFPRVRTAGIEIVGPIPPGDGRSGSLVLMHELRRPGQTSRSGGKIALHLRLASLTELLGAEDEAGVFRPLLLTPGGGVYSNVGLPLPAPPKVIQGAEILPGWRPALAVEEHRLTAGLRLVRYALLAGVLMVVALVAWLFLSLQDRIRGRVRLLMDGASAVASGDLSWRIATKGRDEIDNLGHAFNAMAERLQKMLRATIDVEKMAVLGQFATGVAHEVRNPLAAIKTSVQVLLPQESDEDRRYILRGMVEEIDRLEGNVNDLLNFARPRDARVEAVAVAGLVDHLVDLVAKQAGDSHISIEAVPAPGLVLRADAGHVQQILMNLVLNALQAMPQGGHLQLRANRRGEVGVLQVVDSGTGIPPDLIPKITEPFFTTRPKGTGLGLAITRQLVEMNGGHLEFSSRVGEGTTVTVTLPLAKDV